MTKLCTKCCREKRFAHFYKRRASHDGLASRCKLCIDVAVKAYHARNADSQKAYKAKWYQENKLRYAAIQKKRREADPEKYRAARQACYYKNHIKKLEAGRRHKKNNPQSVIKEIAKLSIVKSAGCRRRDIPAALLDVKILHIKLIRAIAEARRVA